MKHNKAKVDDDSNLVVMWTAESRMTEWAVNAKKPIIPPHVDDIRRSATALRIPTTLRLSHFAKTDCIRKGKQARGIGVSTYILWRSAGKRSLSFDNLEMENSDWPVVLPIISNRRWRLLLGCQSPRDFGVKPDGNDRSPSIPALDPPHFFVALGQYVSDRCMDRSVPMHAESFEHRT